MARLTARFGLTRYEADEHYKMALDAYKKRNLEEALLNLERAIELLPGNSEYYAARGFMYLEDGVKDKALADFEEAVKRHPYEVLAHYGRGVIAYQNKNWDEALAHFNDAYVGDPKRPETLYYLGLVHHRKDDNATALGWMQQAQEGFKSSNDKRRADAGRWVRELQKLVDKG